MGRVLDVVPIGVAVLCLLAFIPWSLGVPGVENDYARGWSIGFYALLLYPLGIAVLGGLRLLGRFDRLQLPMVWLRIASWVLLGAFAVAQLVAWLLILS